MNIESAPPSGDMSYEEAVLYCTFCRHNGHSDWRMPTRDEYSEMGISGWYLDDHDLDEWPALPVRDI